MRCCQISDPKQQFNDCCPLVGNNCRSLTDALEWQKRLKTDLEQAFGIASVAPFQSAAAVSGRRNALSPPTGRKRQQIGNGIL